VIGCLLAGFYFIAEFPGMTPTATSPPWLINLRVEALALVVAPLLMAQTWIPGRTVCRKIKRRSDGSLSREIVYLALPCRAYAPLNATEVVWTRPAGLLLRGTV